MGAGDDAARKRVRSLIRAGVIRYAGNRKLNIYGKLGCASGKRMKPGNRVFFTSEEEALALGFRPCRHCMKENARPGFQHAHH